MHRELLLRRVGKFLFVKWQNVSYVQQCGHWGVRTSHTIGQSTVQQFIHTNKEEGIEAPYYRSFVRGIHRWPRDSPHIGDQLIPLTKGRAEKSNIKPQELII